MLGKNDPQPLEPLMFSFEQVDFLYEPYPIGLIKPVMEQDFYDTLVDSFPPLELFEYKPEFGSKYILSEKYNGRQYHDFVAKNPAWRDFRGWIKSRAFVESVDAFLREHDIDVGMKRRWPKGYRKLRQVVHDIGHGQTPRLGHQLRTRFEFSALPADGGCILPHTDNPAKIVIMVVPMVKEGEWDPSYGGGTEVDRPLSHRYAYNWLNRQIPFEEVETLNTFEFGPNQCVIFVRTFNSLHCVRPMTGKGSKVIRRSLTINIETQDL
jgi:hypothetical protein